MTDATSDEDDEAHPLSWWETQRRSIWAHTLEAQAQRVAETEHHRFTALYHNLDDRGYMRETFIAEHHTRLLQRHFTTHNQGARRVADNVLVTEPTLWDGQTPGYDGLLDVGFNVGRFGRFEWE